MVSGSNTIIRPIAHAMFISIAPAGSQGSDEPAHQRRLVQAFTARIHKNETLMNSLIKIKAFSPTRKLLMIDVTHVR